MQVLPARQGRCSSLSSRSTPREGLCLSFFESFWAAFQSAFDLSVNHEFRMWDALVMAVAADNRCRIVLSEDLQHGFTWRGVTIVNPFLPDESPLLAAILSPDG